MKEEVVKELEEIRNDGNVVFRRMRIVKKKACDLVGNNCIKDKDRKIFFAEDGRKKVRKEHIEAIMKNENPWDGIVNVDVVECLVEPFASDDHEEC